MIMDQANLVKPMHVEELLGYSVSCIDFDLTSPCANLHLTHLLAGFILKFQKFDLHYNSNDFNMSRKPSAVELMEPILNLQVRVAKVSKKFPKGIKTIPTKEHVKI